MPDKNPSESGYSQEYVEKLRREAADWRTKYRDLESGTMNDKISVELAKRGVQAEPSWVQVNDGMSAIDAVENFVAKYPHLVDQAPTNNTQETPSNTEPPVRQPIARAPAAEPPGGKRNTNQSVNPQQGRALSEIKKDPVARGQLRDRYRQMLQEQSRQRSTI